MSERPRSTFGDFTTARTAAGVDVFLLPTRKFKTRLLRVHLRARSSDRNALRALVPNLLRRGTRRHPSMAAVSREFESLYGSHWSSSVYKLGSEQVTSIRLDTVGESFLPGRPPIFAPAVELVRELLDEPRLVDGRFPADIFEQERLNHRREIEAQYNDKMTWAFQRVLDLMFPDEPYGRPVLGTLEETARATSDGTVEAWQELRLRLPARVFAVGDFALEDVVRIAEQLLPASRPAAPATSEPARPAPKPAREVVEREEISQSKLISTRQVDLTGLDERGFDALRIYAGILGGGFHSRLFQSVRERHSMAYFASASLDRLRGVLFTLCGIDAADRARVCELVEREIASLRADPPRADELEQTRRLMISGSRGMFDSPGGMVESLEAGLAVGRVRPLDAVCRSLAAVTAEDVQAAARRIGPLELTYCLEGESRHDGA